MQFQYNRGARRRLKKILKMPFTPSRDFTEKHMTQATEAMKVEADKQAGEPVKVRVPRAFKDEELSDVT